VQHGPAAEGARHAAEVDVGGGVVGGDVGGVVVDQLRGRIGINGDSCCISMAGIMMLNVCDRIVERLESGMPEFAVKTKDANIGDEICSDPQNTICEFFTPANLRDKCAHFTFNNHEKTIRVKIHNTEFESIDYNEEMIEALRSEDEMVIYEGELTVETIVKSTSSGRQYNESTPRLLTLNIKQSTHTYEWIFNYIPWQR
jgi:hypothetical protein